MKYITITQENNNLFVYIALLFIGISFWNRERPQKVKNIIFIFIYWAWLILNCHNAQNSWQKPPLFCRTVFCEGFPNRNQFVWAESKGSNSPKWSSLWSFRFFETPGDVLIVEISLFQDLFLLFLYCTTIWNFFFHSF